MNWKFAGDRPVYQQIMENIRGAVLRGELPPGGRVPSVRELAMQAQVNPNTMQRALTELERDGLVYSQRTAGRFVTEDTEMIRTAKEELAHRQIKGFLTAMLRLGYEKAEILSLVDRENVGEELEYGDSGM